jgi:porphobilinogen deaminase
MLLMVSKPLTAVPPAPFPAVCTAGLARLGQQSLVTRVLDFDEMLPAACQGAIGVTCSASDPFIRW